MSENVGNSVYNDLRSNQRKAIDALLNGKSKQEAADEAGVTLRTVDRWHAEPDFALALSQGGDQVLKGAATRLKASLNTAIDVFQEVMADKKASVPARLRAANMVSNHALRLSEMADLVERLERLERLINGKS